MSFKDFLGKINIFDYYFSNRYERYYKKNKPLILFDLLLVAIMIVLAAVIVRSEYLVKKNISTQAIKHQPLEGKNIVIQEPEIEIGLSSKQKTARYGQALKFDLSISNKGSVPADKLKVYFFSANENFSLSVLKMNSNEIASTSGRNYFFKPIMPGQEVNAAIDSKFFADNKSTEQSEILGASYSYESRGKIIKKTVYSDRVKLLSNISVSAVAYYNSPQGDQLGVGPVPPVVDIPTTYWIFWEVKNYGNDLKNLKVEGQLPENVNLTGNKSLLAGKFNATGRNLVWTVDEIDKTGGNYRIGFEVEIIPSLQDMGKVPVLLSNSKFSVTDNYCKAGIDGRLPKLTTNLEFDRLNQGKGKVID